MRFTYEQKVVSSEPVRHIFQGSMKPWGLCWCWLLGCVHSAEPRCLNDWWCTYRSFFVLDLTNISRTYEIAWASVGNMHCAELRHKETIIAPRLFPGCVYKPFCRERDFIICSTDHTVSLDFENSTLYGPSIILCRCLLLPCSSWLGLPAVPRRVTMMPSPPWRLGATACAPP